MPVPAIARNGGIMSVLSAIRISQVPVFGFMTVGWFWGSFAAQAPVLKAQIGADDATFGLLLLGTSIGLLATLLVAPLYDKAMGARAMPRAALVFALVMVLPGLATTPLVFFLAMTLCGLCSGLLDVTMNARVSELEARNSRPLMNANHAMFSVAYACSAMLTGAAREAGLPPPVIFAALAVLTLLASRQMWMEPEQVEEAPDAVRRFPWGVVGLCGAVVLIAFMAEAAVEAWSALHVERTLGGRAAEGALGPAMLGLTMAFGRFSGQAVAERFSAFTVIFWAGLLAMIGAILAATAQSPMMAYLGFGTIGLGVSVIGPLGLALVGQLVPPHMRTLAISRAAALGFAGFFLAPAAMGILSQFYGLRVAFGAIGLLVSFLFVLLPILKRRSRP